MGREIKRVALDFDYPINQMIWKGYANPYRGLECKVCSGTGESPEVKRLSEDWYGFERHESKWCYSITQDEVQALLDAGRLMDFTRNPRNEKQRADVEKKIADGGNSWLPYDNGYIPTADEINEWAKVGLGHDSINQWICVEARAKRLGIAELKCGCCKGEGVLWPDDKYAKLSEEFEWIDPPAGDGYQLWSTTTEGTPMSPVFATAEELARWLSDNNASTFASCTATYEEWLKFILGPAWAPSMIYSSKGVQSGVIAAKGVGHAK